MHISSSQPIKRIHHTHLRAVLTVLGQFLALEAGEGDGGVALRHDVLRVEDVEQLVAFKAVEVGVVSIQLTLELVTTVRIPGERPALVAQILGERLEVVSGEGQFQNRGTM